MTSSDHVTGGDVDDDPTGLPLPLLVGTLDATLAGEILQGAAPTPAAPVLVSRRELLALVRELRLIDDRMPAEARAGLLARKRAMIDRLEPRWYDVELHGFDIDLGDAAAVAAWEQESDLEASELLEHLVSGGTHPKVAPRAEPSTPGWDVMLEQLAARYEAAVAAIDEFELECAVNGGSFPDSLREVLESVARRRGGSEALVETRPGSWEADHIRGLVAMVDYELDHELEQYAAPVVDGAAGAER